MSKWRHLDLFSGILGFPLAGKRVWGDDHEMVSFCDIEPFSQDMGAKHWPGVPFHDDIKTMKGSDYANIDLLTGGFPCQPYSQAGQRRGSEDDRHLWPEMLRVIREAKPRWVVGENVRGLTNWNGGVVFNEVLSDLEAEGYRVQSFLLPACAVDAPHRRDRIWIIGFRSPQRTYTNSSRLYREKIDKQRDSKLQTKQECVPGQVGQNVADTEHYGNVRRNWELGTIKRKMRDIRRSEKNGGGKRWLPEPNVGRVANGIPSRVDRLKGLGNAIVPQVAEMIFKSIKAYENE